MNNRYVYPAIFTHEAEGGYSVTFPDIDGCYACGDTLYDAIDMAMDILALVMYHRETEGEDAPEASDLKDIRCQSNQFTSYVIADTTKYRKYFKGK